MGDLSKCAWIILAVVFIETIMLYSGISLNQTFNWYKLNGRKMVK